MLSRRLTVGVVAVAALLTSAGCGVLPTGDPDERRALEKPIEDVVIRPGVTAIQQAPVLACEANQGGLLQAIEMYEVINGELPADEAALIEAGLLREDLEDWDVVDGQIVSDNPECGPAATVTPTTIEIVTESEGATVDDLFALYDEEFIAQVGGADCARELAVIGVAGERYEAREGTAPLSLDDLRADFDEPVVLWTYDPALDELVPTDGSPCTLNALEPNE